MFQVKTTLTKIGSHQISGRCNSIIVHEQTPLSSDTIDSVLRHREVGRAKDLSAPLVVVLLMLFSLQKFVLLVAMLVMILKQKVQNCVVCCDKVLI
jgi:hypothetical protein